MLKPILILTVAGVMAAGAPTAVADDARYDHRGHSHHAGARIAHFDDGLTRGERRDLRRLQRFDRRDLSRAERRYLRRLQDRVDRAYDRHLRQQRQLQRRRDSVRFHRHARGHRCQLRNRHYHDGRVFHGRANGYLAAAVATAILVDALDD